MAGSVSKVIKPQLHQHGTLPRAGSRFVADVARQSLCQKSLNHNSTNMGRFRELAADLRHNNTQIEWTKGHTENTSLESDLNREADACCTGAYDDELFFRLAI